MRLAVSHIDTEVAWSSSYTATLQGDLLFPILLAKILSGHIIEYSSILRLGRVLPTVPRGHFLSLSIANTAEVSPINASESVYSLFDWNLPQEAVGHILHFPGYKPMPCAPANVPGTMCRTHHAGRIVSATRRGTEAI